MKQLHGTCVCPGEIVGTVKLFQPGRSYTKNDVVVMQNWLTQEVLQTKGAGAIISATGGLTCHASIVARELGVPALINVNITALHEGTTIKVDTAAEILEIL